MKSAVNDATTLNGDDVSYATTALEQIVNLKGIDPKVQTIDLDHAYVCL